MYALTYVLDPCTKGVWIWSVDPSHLEGVPTRWKEKNTRVLLLDTEGLGSFRQTADYDTHIFSLTLLLSSYFIYNSMGTIDEKAIDHLSVVIHMTRRIRAELNKDDPDGLKQFMPPFLWLVRDFSLELVMDGEEVTEREYLERTLRPLEGDTASVEGPNRIRRYIKEYFQDRDCFTLVRPVIDEALLRKIDRLEHSQFRPEYVEQLGKLSKLVYSRLERKKVGGHLVNGRMFCDMARQYVQAINEGDMPTISNVWDNVIKLECTRALKASHDEYVRLMAEELEKNGPMSDSELFHLHGECQKKAVALFRKHSVGEGTGSVEQELFDSLEKEFSHIALKNESESRKLCEKVAKGVYEEMNQRQSKGEFTDLEGLFHGWKIALDQYFRSARGPFVERVALEAIAVWRDESIHECVNELMGKCAEESEKRAKEVQDRAAVEYERLNELYSSMEEQMRSLRGVHADLKGKNEEMEETVEKLRTDLREREELLKKGDAAFVEQRENLTKEVEMKDSEIELLHSELEEKTKSAEEVEKKLQADVEAVRKENEQLKADNAELQKKADKCCSIM
eukprot:TRINITY_DN1310_c0_g1_i1.p1 TRINITY_DN1310_c0_g1~~TRINITY_DN1310_c0_g1_i1.p1  ORF type:complete len:566 (-),score=162.09 TRINITY_DN1310_c0_g1_i1:1418-3115(-)